MALLGLAAALRIAALLRRESFWSDEAALALNIVDRPFAELARPFIHAQVAPYLYLLVQKLISQLAGASDLSLRALSLASGIAFLFVLYALTRRVADAWAALAALAIASSNPLAVYYSTELKPYGSDALISALLVLWCLPALSVKGREFTPRTLARLTAAGVIAPWLSLPAAFVLAGAGSALALALFERQAGRREWLRLVAIGVSWAASFAAQYLLFLRPSEADAAYLQRYWSSFDGFPPAQLAQALHWYAAKLFYLFATLVASVGGGQRYLAAGLWLFGLWLLWKQRRPLACLFAVPVAALLAASAVHGYAIADRLVLFMTPLLLVPCANALLELARTRPPVTNVAVLGLVLALCGRHSVAALENLRVSPPATDMRSLTGYLAAHIRADDQLCVDSHVAFTFEYYARRRGLLRPFRVIETAQLAGPSGAQRPTAPIAEPGRVWLIVPTLGPRGPRFIAGTDAIVSAELRLHSALGHAGRKLDSYDGTNVRLSLYELSQAAHVH